MFSESCVKKLEKLHPDLTKVIIRASEMLKDYTIIITETDRSKERQAELFKKKATKTLRSRHISENNACKLSCAVDIAVKVDGKITWEWSLYEDFSKYVKKAAEELRVEVEWGGDWKSFKDGPHYQLPKSLYPEV